MPSDANYYISAFVILLIIFLGYYYYTYERLDESRYNHQLDRYFGQGPVNLKGWVSNNPNFGYLPNLAR